MSAVSTVVKAANPIHRAAQRLAVDLGLPVEKVEAIMEQLGSSGVEVDEEGRLVGVVLTLHPTPHRFRVKGNDLYAGWSARSTAGSAFATPGRSIRSACAPAWSRTDGSLTQRARWRIFLRPVPPGRPRPADRYRFPFSSNFDICAARRP